MSYQHDATNRYRKYPKTPHLPESPHFDARDDLKLTNVDHLAELTVVVTEKLDGENTTMYNDHIHARSVDSGPHPSRTWVKALHGRIAHEIPDGWRICGENLYATHSIHYTNLPSYFMVFAIFDDNDTCLSWDDTTEIARSLQLDLVPVLSRGPFKLIDLASLANRKSSFGGESEGFVVRNQDSFPYSDFANHVAKYVRPLHVGTDQHWMTQLITPNELAPPPGLAPEGGFDISR